MRIVIEPDDSAGQRKIAMGLQECSLAEVIEQDLSTDGVDIRMRQAMVLLKEERVIRRPFDYTWIMVMVNQGFVEDLKPFVSYQSFREHLLEIGVRNVPCRSTLCNAYKKFSGKWPNLAFSDTDDPKETLRRNNVGRRFLSAFKKKK